MKNSTATNATREKHVGCCVKASEHEKSLKSLLPTHEKFRPILSKVDETFWDVLLSKNLTTIYFIKPNIKNNLFTT